MDYTTGNSEYNPKPIQSACCGVCGRCDSVRRRLNAEKSSSEYN